MLHLTSVQVPAAFDHTSQSAHCSHHQSQHQKQEPVAHILVTIQAEQAALLQMGDAVLLPDGTVFLCNGAQVGEALAV